MKLKIEILLAVVLGLFALSARAQFTTNAPAAIDLSADTYTALLPVTNNVERSETAAAFIARAQLVLQRQQRAVDTLWRRFATAHLDTNWVELYLFAGSTETNHTPDFTRGTNGLVWHGAARHTTNGATSLGTNLTAAALNPVALGMDTNEWFLYAYVSFTNAADPYALAMLQGPGAGIGFGPLTNVLVKTDTGGIVTNECAALVGPHCLFFRTNGNDNTWVYSGGWTNFTTQSVSAVTFASAQLTLFGVTNVDNGLTKTNLGGGVLKAIGIGTGRLTYSQATNLFDTMRNYQRSLFRATD